MRDVDLIKQKYDALSPWMDERMRRLWAGAEAKGLGWGGITTVAAATGMARATIAAGLQEVQMPRADTQEARPATPRIRRQGGGRKRLTDQDATLRADLESLVDPLTRGDPQSPLRWTCKSTRRLAQELGARGHRVGERTVARLLRELNYSLQANQKTREAASHPDRTAQFEHINAQTQAFQQRGQPVISVDTKKKELVGDFKNAGREWQPQGQPEAVRVHDFADEDFGKAIPYGVYDVTKNEAWVSVGCDHDTAEFAAQAVRRWWQQMGAVAYPQARELLITADGGGSNGTRSRLWKVELQRLSDQTGLQITVCHLPPGTSKWNKIEHRLFAWVTQNWRGRPLVSHEVVVNLIGSTRTRTGLRVQAELDPSTYPTGRKVSDEELAAIEIEREAFHGEWNYTIVPRSALN